MEGILSSVFSAVLSEAGVIGACFVTLLLWTMRENKDRELKYQDTIEKNHQIILEQARNFDIVKEIRDDVLELREAVDRKI